MNCFVETLTTTSNTGETAVDDALKQFGISGYSALKNTFANAYSSSGLSAQDFLEQVCGVRRNNDDTGAITGSDAGGSTVKTEESIIPEGTIAYTLDEDDYDSFTVNGLTVHVTYGGSGYSETERRVVEYLYNWWIPQSLDLINELLGINFTDGRASTNTLNVKFRYSDYSVTDPAALSVTNDLGRASSATMTIDIYKLRSWDSSDQSGELSSGYLLSRHTDETYMDQCVLKQLAELALRANVSYFYDLPEGIQNGLKYIVGGLDYADYSDYAFASNSYWGSSGDLGVTTAYTLMRWFAKNYSDGYPGDIIYVHDDNATGNSGADEFIITSSVDAATINTGGGADIINGRSGADDLKIVQPSGNTDKITIVGAGGNDTLEASDGADVFSYNVGDGNDVIYAFSADVDEINLGSDSYSTSRSGADFVVKVGSGSITLKNVVSNDITISSMPTGLSKSGDKIIVNSSCNGNVWLTGFDVIAWVDTYEDLSAVEVDASADTRAERIIVGNEKSNGIRAGVNGSWMWGFVGDDTLVGGAGEDMYWFGKGEGSDVIENCGAEDIVNFWTVNLEDMSGVSMDSNDNITFTLTDGNSLKINTTGTSTTFQLPNLTRWKFEHSSRQFTYVQS